MMKSYKEKWLLTGGNGFIGSNLKEKIRKKFNNIELLSPSSKELDLRDYNKTLDYIKENEVDIVIHLAANMTGIGDLTEKPLKYFEDNTLMNFTIVKASLKAGVKRFLTFGSTCGFSRQTPIPMMEEHFWQGRPENTYGTAKLMMLEHLLSQNQMEWLYLVPANVYGVGDHFDLERSHVIPATILKFDRARLDSKKVDVWGDGSQIRDFIYVDDLTDVVCQFIDLDKWKERVVNVSTGKGVTIKDIVLNIRNSMKFNDIEINWLLEKPTGLPVKIINNDKFTDIFGEYDFTSIEEGIKRTVKWYLNTK